MREITLKPCYMVGASGYRRVAIGIKLVNLGLTKTTLLDTERTLDGEFVQCLPCDLFSYSVFLISGLYITSRPVLFPPPEIHWSCAYGFIITEVHRKSFQENCMVTHMEADRCGR